jgi:hypothetical protein
MYILSEKTKFMYFFDNNFNLADLMVSSHFLRYAANRVGLRLERAPRLLDASTQAF